MLVLVAAVVALSAPLAFYSMGCLELRERASRDALNLAEALGREAEERPVLWSYDSIRLLEHARAYRDLPHVGRIEVVEESDRLLDPGADLAAGDLLWERAAIVARDREVGAVWVGMDAGPLRARAVALGGIFLGLGLALVVGIHAIAIRSARRAQAEIDELIEALARARSEEHVRALAVRSVLAQESERRAIARDLHDSVGQAITAIRIQAELLGSSARDPAKVAAIAGKIASTSDTTLEEVRRAITRLGPAVLEELGLRGAIERLVEDLREATALEIDLAIEPPGLELAPALELTAYRVAQESLTNIARHAEASRVEISITHRAGALEITIGDDGRSAGEVLEAEGHGLRSMRERVELLGGSLQVESSAGGTRIRARVPIAG